MTQLPIDNGRSLPAPATPAAIDPYGAPPAEPQQVNLFKLAHRLLRGRYILAIVLASVGAAAGAAAGYISQTPKYRSQGLVRIQPVLPKIIYQTEQSSVPPLFSSFVNTQAQLITSDRVVNRAMRSNEWQKLGRIETPETQKEFRESIKVGTSRDSLELITVAFLDENPTAALTGLRETIQAYRDLYANAETRDVRDLQVRTLDQRRRDLESSIRSRRESIQLQAAEFGTDDLTRMHEFRTDQLLQLEAQLAELENRLTNAGIDVASGATSTAPAALGSPGQPGGEGDPEAQAEASAAEAAPTPAEIATVDRQMAEYLTQRSSFMRLYNSLRAQGYGEQQRDVLRVSAELKAIDQTIENYAVEWASTRKSLTGEAGGVSGVETIAQLEDRYRKLKNQTDAWRRDTVAIGNRRLAIEAYKREIDTLQATLDEIVRRLDQINIESKVEEQIGRIEVILPEQASAAAVVDNRKKYAAVGFVLGGGLPVALVALLGLIDGRMRYSDQAKDGPIAGAPLLGILPLLPRDTDDPEQAAAAAHCVHQLRTLLQIGGGERKVYGITSATAADGKTSLALSMGISFAASGSKTLLVDFDMIGRGLSRVLKVLPEHGLMHSLRTGETNGSISATRIENLSLLAAGKEDDVYVSRLSRGMVSDLIDRLRDQYDVVIVDTGPILGSLEANYVASVSDGMILVVGRGQQQSYVQRACEQLRSLNANIIGMVFNRANSGDFNSSATSKSFRSVRVDAPSSLKKLPGTEHLDPLSRTVAMDTGI